MASSSAANHSNSASSSSSMEAYAMYKELAESDAKEVGQVIDKRISKIYQRLKETDSNLKAMEKLMIHRKPSSGRNSSTVDGDVNHHHDSRPVSYQRLTQSMQDLYDAKSPLQETVQSPQKSSTDRQFNVQMQLSNLENQQSKLHDAVEMLNRNFETSSSRGLQMNGDVGAGEQVKTSMEQLSRELQRMTRDLEMAKVASTDREKELKIRARKSTYSWRSKCESLLVDKKYLEDQLLKSRDQIQMSMREREILHLQLDEIHNKLKTEVHQREELKMQLSESRDESVKKDDILHRFKKLYDDTRDELTLLKAELDNLQISYQQVADEKTSFYKDKVTLEKKMKSQEENFQKELNQQTISSSQAEIVKKLENENQILQQTLAEMQKNDGKTSVEMDSVLKSLEEKNTVLALKNEKVAGELDCLKSELQELKAKHDRVLKDYYAKSEECFSKAKRISRLEDSLKDSCKTLNYKEQDFKVMLASVSLEIDKIINIWNSATGNLLPVQGLIYPVTPSSSHAKIHWVDIQSKLKLLQDELASWTNLSYPSKSFKQSTGGDQSAKTSTVHELREKNVLGTSESPMKNVPSPKTRRNQVLNIGHQRGRKKVNSTKIPTGGEISSINENISSHKFLHNSSLSLSSINKSAESSESSS